MHWEIHSQSVVDVDGEYVAWTIGFKSRYRPHSVFICELHKDDAGRCRQLGAHQTQRRRSYWEAVPNCTDFALIPKTDFLIAVNVLERHLKLASKISGNVLAYIPYQYTREDDILRESRHRYLTRAGFELELVDEFVVLNGNGGPDFAWDVFRVIENYHHHQMAQTRGDHQEEGAVNGAQVKPTLDMLPDITIRLNDVYLTRYSRRNIMFTIGDYGVNGRKFCILDQHLDPTQRHQRTKDK